MSPAILALRYSIGFFTKDSPKSMEFESEFERNLFELRRSKLEEIEKLGQAAYPNQFAFSHTIPAVRAKWGEAAGEGSAEALEAERPQVAVAGRIMAIRQQGKAGFATLQQEAARLQIYVRLDAVGEQNFALYKLLDLGDHIGVSGYLFRTRTGELRSTSRRLRFLPRRCSRCRRSITALPMSSCATGSGMSICSPTSTAAKSL